MINTLFSCKLPCKEGVKLLCDNKVKQKQLVVPALKKKQPNIKRKPFEIYVSKYVTGNFKFAVPVVYRSPKSNAEEFLDRLGLLIDVRVQ